MVHLSMNQVWRRDLETHTHTQMQNPPPALYTLSFGIRRLRFKRTAPQHWYLKARALPAALQTGRNLLQEACLLIPFASRVYGRVWDSSLEIQGCGC